eukprot:15694-Heterococcus_DN1.PRE.2
MNGSSRAQHVLNSSQELSCVSICQKCSLPSNLLSRQGEAGMPFQGVLDCSAMMMHAAARRACCVRAATSKSWRMERNS